MRRLLLAAEGKQRFHWELNSQIAYLLAEANRDKKRRPRPYTPADFNPFSAPKKPAGLGSVAEMLLPADKAGKVAQLVAEKEKAKKSGDWTEFKRLAAEINNAP